MDYFYSGKARELAGQKGSLLSSSEITIGCRGDQGHAAIGSRWVGKHTKMRKVIGYARVSTVEQSLSLQIRALETAGCDRILLDEGVSGASVSRPGLQEVIAALEPGDMLVVWRLDRLGRSLVHLVSLINDLAERQVEFRSLTENIDTSSAGGRLVFHMMAALAEFERSLISERTRAGMEAVQLEGRHIGRPSALSDDERQSAIAAVIDRGENFSTVAQRYRVHARTIRRAVRNHLETVAIGKIGEGSMQDGQACG